MMQKKLAVAAVLVVVLLAAGVGVAAPAAAESDGAQRFTDVPAGHWAFEAIEWAAEAGVTVGYGDGTFRPQQPLSRSHAVVFMERYYDEILGAEQSQDFTRADMMVLLKAINDGTLRGGEAPEDPAPGGAGAADSARFADVPIGHWAFEAVEWAAEAGVTVGYGDGTFRPQQPLSRSHAVVFMERYYKEILGAEQSQDFARGDMMVLLKAINDGTLRSTGNFKAVTAGWGHTCGLRNDNTITCWGANYSGQADVPAGSYTAVTAGGAHTCGLRSDNTVTCWGYNYSGQADVPAGSFKAVTAGAYHSCGLRSDSTVTCWGGNYSGQADVPAGSFKAVTDGWSITCGLRSDSTVTCWGRNWYGQADAPAGSYTAVTAGRGYTCGLRSDNTITCWGWNDEGQADAPAGSYTAVTAGKYHTCGLRSDNTITCWGRNWYGQADAPAGSYTAVTAGDYHSCGLRSDNTITCWGRNDNGQTDAPAEADPGTSTTQTEPEETDEPETTVQLAGCDAVTSVSPGKLRCALPTVTEQCAPVFDWIVAYWIPLPNESGLAPCGVLYCVSPLVQLNEFRNPPHPSGQSHPSGQFCVNGALVECQQEALFFLDGRIACWEGDLDQVPDYSGVIYPCPAGYVLSWEYSTDLLAYTSTHSLALEGVNGVCDTLTAIIDMGWEVVG